MDILAVLSKRRFFALFAFLSFLFLVFYLVVTGIYVVSLWEFNQTTEPLRLALVILISVLAGLAVTLMFYKQSQPLVCSQNAPAFFGSAIALFTTGCPVCFPVLLSALGVGGATALAVSQNATYIQIISALLLVGSVWLISKN